MTYTPHTQEQVKEMLDVIGIENAELPSSSITAASIVSCAPSE